MIALTDEVINNLTHASFAAMHESACGTKRPFNDVRSYVGSWG
jgi:hypothetical protein